MASSENKTVIVTGCSSGIGLATTLLFLSQNARVFGIDISPFNHELDTTQKESFAFHEADLCKPGAAEEAIFACIARYGPNIDVLANVAGVMDAFGSADTVKDSEWERVLTINLTVPVRMMAAVLPSMKDQKSGAIVNVGSYEVSRVRWLALHTQPVNMGLSVRPRTSLGAFEKTVLDATLYFQVVRIASSP
jgi:NADP-dependent 3-hydroxy acid dehydrogenase YdfG